MNKCPESMEELNELESMIPMCRKELYAQAASRIESGAAKNISDASRQIAEETNRNPESIRKAITRAKTEKIGTVSQLLGDDLVNEVVKETNEIKRENQKQRKLERDREDAILAADYVEDSSTKIIQGDFRDVCKGIGDESIDLILTDLPYPREYLPLWNNLSYIAARVLKPDGFLIAYSGQYHLPYVIRALSERLNYFWTFALYHKGRSQIVNNRNLMCKWKPILIFRNGDNSRFDTTIPDYVVSEQPEKDDHEWQQGESAIAELIEYFTKPNDIILDVCAGSGTTGAAAKKLKRRSILIDIEEDNIATIKRRLSNE